MNTGFVALRLEHECDATLEQAHEGIEVIFPDFPHLVGTIYVCSYDSSVQYVGAEFTGPYAAPAADYIDAVVNRRNVLFFGKSNGYEILPDNSGEFSEVVRWSRVTYAVEAGPPSRLLYQTDYHDDEPARRSVHYWTIPDAEGETWLQGISSFSGRTARAIYCGR